MQINGVGNNQIGNSYQNPNRMPNTATGKKEDDDVNKRLEAMGVKVELSFQQAPAQEQETVKEPLESKKSQETTFVLSWIKKIWEAGIAWLKRIWNDEQSTKDHEADLTSQEMVDAEEDALQTEMPGVDADVAESEMFDSDMKLMAESPLDEEADYAAMYARTTAVQQGASTAENTSQVGQFDFRVTDEEQVSGNTDKYRMVGIPLHTSGMQDSYNRYGQHSKLGVEPSNNMQIRK